MAISSREMLSIGVLARLAAAMPTIRQMRWEARCMAVQCWDGGGSNKDAVIRRMFSRGRMLSSQGNDITEGEAHREKMRGSR